MKSADQAIFENGAAYERFMGRWSRQTGRQFVKWLQVGPGAEWLELGCGTGAFTEVILSECEPSSITALDLSAAHVAYARERIDDGRVEIETGNATAIHAEDAQFDAAVSALVLNFIPDQKRAVEEMRRVVRPGGTVAGYVWDFASGGHISQHLTRAISAVVPDAGDLSPALRSESTSQEALATLFRSGGLAAVETASLDIVASFDDFEDYWISNTNFTSTMGNICRLLAKSQIEAVQHALREILPRNSDESVSVPARASGVRGTVPSK